MESLQVLHWVHVKDGFRGMYPNPKEDYHDCKRNLLRRLAKQSFSQIGVSQQEFFSHDNISSLVKKERENNEDERILTPYSQKPETVEITGHHRDRY